MRTNSPHPEGARRGGIQLKRGPGAGFEVGRIVRRFALQVKAAFSVKQAQTKRAPAPSKAAAEMTQLAERLGFDLADFFALRSVGKPVFDRAVCKLLDGAPKISPIGDKIGDMRATVGLDDELIRKAQEISGVTERTALLREALKALIHLEASRRLAAVGGTEPDLEEIKRVRTDNL
jgi:hypothetical protein